MARRTKEEAEQTRNQILDSAEVLFQSQGVSRTSLQAIAAHAGITRGAIYWHFKDKGDLFNAMMERVIWPMEQCCMDMGSPDFLANDLNPIATLRKHQIETLHTIATNDRIRRILEIAIFQVELTDDMQVVRDRVKESYEDFYQRNLQIFSLPRLRHNLRPQVIAECAARTMQSVIFGLIETWILTPTHFDLVETGTQSIDCILEGIGFGKFLPNNSQTPLAPL